MNREERIGELFIFGELVFHSFFPVIINYSAKIVPPIFFAAGATLVAAACIFLFLLFTNGLRAKISRQALYYILLVTLFIVIIPSIFIFIGTRATSGINTSILLQTEILFTFIILGLLGKEAITGQKLSGALAVLLGGIAVLYNGSFKLNPGDLFIVAGVFFYPIGNIFAKKALRLTQPAVILFIRSLLGGGVLLAVSLAFEQFNRPAVFYFKDQLVYFLLCGVVVYFIAKMMWYEGLKRIQITKAVPIALSSPALSIVYAVAFLKEMPTVFQIAGFLTVLLGLFVITWKPSRETLAAK